MLYNKNNIFSIFNVKHFYCDQLLKSLRVTDLMDVNEQICKCKEKPVGYEVITKHKNKKVSMLKKVKCFKE